MKNRRRNNIIIGTLCAVLVLMGVGYAILSTTLNIGGTANINSNFNIHFLTDDDEYTEAGVLKRGISLIDYENSTSSNTVYNTTVNSTLASTMESSTGVDTLDPTEATFSAVLQKPTDYATFTAIAKNYGTIKGIISSVNITSTPSQELTTWLSNNNGGTWDDYFEVTTTAAQNTVLNPEGEYEFTITVRFKESADKLPQGALNNEITITYVQDNGQTYGNDNQSGIATYTGVYSDPDDNEFDGEPLSITLQDEQDGTKSIAHFMFVSEDIAPMFQQQDLAFVPYDTNITIIENYLGITPTSGDYVIAGNNKVIAILHNNVIYIQLEVDEDAPVQQLILSGESSSGSNQQSEPQQQSQNDWTFKINNQGIITAYNYDHGTNVVVPATINGITVTGIQPTSNGGDIQAAFTGGNIAIYEDNGTAKAIINDSTNFNTIKTAFLAQYGSAVSEENVELGLIKDAGDNILMQMYYDVDSSSWKGSALTSIDLSNTSITTIKTVNFFDGLVPISKLISVKLPSTITTIEESAFYGCNNLTDIYTPLSQSDFESNVTLGENWNPSGATIHYNYQG